MAAAPADAEVAATLTAVAHDLNNPLAAIRILAEVLGSEVDDPLLKQDIEDVLEATDAAAALVDSLAAWARAMGGPIPRANAPFDLLEVVREVCGRAALRRHVHFDDPGTPVSVSGDRDGVRQAVSDLCFNAIKMTGEGRPVEVTVRSASVSIRAGGPALSADVLPALVAPGGAASLRAAKVPVLAVGLHAARVALEAMGWRLRLELLDDRLVAEVMSQSRGDPAIEHV